MSYSSQLYSGSLAPHRSSSPLVAATARAPTSEHDMHSAAQHDDAAPRRAREGSIWIARTCHATPGLRRERVLSPFDRYRISIALAAVDLSIAEGNNRERHISMPVGAAYIAGPGRETIIGTKGPSDFLHLSVSAAFFDQQYGAASRAPRRGRDVAGFVAADQLIEHISRVLVSGPAGWHASYPEILGQLLIARLSALLPRSAPPTPLPVWRLRKVQALVEDQIAAPLRLQDLADAAGLSRMHFAAQFREATGLRPHEYVLTRRIDRAKSLIERQDSAMVEIALDVGFQSQAHFCTIFKRFTGVTPTAWRAALLARRAASAAVSEGQRAETAEPDRMVLRNRRHFSGRLPDPAAARTALHCLPGSTPISPMEETHHA